MKTNLLLIFCCFVTFGLSAQTVIFEDDFESYTVGDNIAASSTSGFWDTWSSAPGGSEDAPISDTYAASGSNSLKITSAKDIVLAMPNTITSKRYRIEFKVYVPAGMYGYYNLLQDFAGSNSTWATQTYIRPDGVATIDAGGTSAATFDQPAGEWFDISYIIDLDDDYCTHYHQATEEVISWPWSLGTAGAGSLDAFDAINFYGWDAEGTAEMYIDDVKITEVPQPGEPIVLTGEINADKALDINWTGTANKYVVVNHSEQLTTTTSNAYTETNLYPQAFDLGVGGHYIGDGYRFSNKLDLDLAGGRDRDFVLFEVVTGTWCPNCPAAARGVEQMHNEDLNVAVIEYHGGDSYETPFSRERISDYYGVSSYPTTIADGDLEYVGGNYGGNLYTTYEGMRTKRMERRALYGIEMDVNRVANNQLEVTVTAEELYDWFEGDVTLRVALTESHIDEAWQGVPMLDFVLRDMYPNAAGTTVDFSNGQATYTFSITIDEAMIVPNNCELIAFLQHDDSGEVLNGQVVVISDVLINTVQVGLQEVNTYPSPFASQLTIDGLENADAQLFTMSGQLVHQFQINSPQHVEMMPQSLNNGSYLLHFTTADGEEGTLKVIKQ